MMTGTLVLLSFLALGDSYTIGEGVPPEQRWPVQLAQSLRADGVPLDDPRIIATTGWTTDELGAAMDLVEPIGNHDVVSLLIGVNNQYRGRNLENYRIEFEALLLRAITLANGRADRLIVLAIPDWGVTPFAAAQGRDAAAIAQQLDAYNAAAAQICAQHGVAFVDTAPVSRARAAEPAMLVDDGLHPSGAMYAQWAQQARPVLTRLLQTP